MTSPSSPRGDASAARPSRPADANVRRGRLHGSRSRGRSPVSGIGKKGLPVVLRASVRQHHGRSDRSALRFIEGNRLCSVARQSSRTNMLTGQASLGGAAGLARLTVWPARRPRPGSVAPETRGAQGAECLSSLATSPAAGLRLSVGGGRYGAPKSVPSFQVRHHGSMPPRERCCPPEPRGGQAVLSRPSPNLARDSRSSIRCCYRRGRRRARLSSLALPPHPPVQTHRPRRRVVSVSRMVG